MNNDRIARMQSLSGESANSKAPKYNVPLIRFDGNTGALEYQDLDKNRTEIKSPIEIVILRNRKRLEDYNNGYSTNEFNTPSQKISLFQSEEGKFKRVDVGTGSELREKYQTLKTQEVLYVLYNNEVCRLTLKGGSSSSFYDYRNALKDEGKHTFSVKTILTVESFQGTKVKKTFKKLAFSYTDIEDDKVLDIVEEKMAEVAKAMAEIDSFNAEKLMSENNENSYQTKEQFGTSSRQSTIPKSLSKDPIDDITADDIDPNEIDF